MPNKLIVNRLLYSRFAADCLATDKDTVQFGEALPLPAGLAVDGDVDTHSCTLKDEAFPWWSVDLGQEYSITSVTIIFPNIARNYRRLVLFYLIILIH